MSAYALPASPWAKPRCCPWCPLMSSCVQIHARSLESNVHVLHSRSTALRATSSRSSSTAATRAPAAPYSSSFAGDAMHALAVVRRETDAQLAGRVREVVPVVGSAQFDGRAERAERVGLALVALVDASLARRQRRRRLVTDVGDRVACRALVPRTAGERLVLLLAQEHYCGSTGSPTRTRPGSATSPKTPKSMCLPSCSRVPR